MYIFHPAELVSLQFPMRFLSFCRSSPQPSAALGDGLLPREHTELLRKKNLLGAPQLMDIAAIYGPTNRKLTRRLVCAPFLDSARSPFESPIEGLQTLSAVLQKLCFSNEPFYAFSIDSFKLIKNGLESIHSLKHGANMGL